MKKKHTTRNYRNYLNASRQYTDGQLIDWAVDNNYNDAQFQDYYQSFCDQVEDGTINEEEFSFSDCICLSDKQRYEIYRYMTEPDYCGIANDSVYFNRGDND